MSYPVILTDFTATDEFGQLIDELALIGDEVVTSPRYGNWRDGWIARETARALGASHVRLIAEERPNFAVRISNREVLYEATEAIKPDRRRHDEYRALRTSGKRITDDPETGWMRPEEVIALLSARASDKASKIYPWGCRLVIYLNVGWIAGRGSITTPVAEQLGLGAIIDAVTPARANFSGVELLHQGMLVAI